MNKQISIAAFQDILGSEAQKDSLLNAIKKLTEVSEPNTITKAIGPQPLGAWGGWPI